MLFLNSNAVSENDGVVTLRGLQVTEYNPTTPLVRPVSKVIQTTEFDSSLNGNAMGWMLDNGVVMSDSPDLPTTDYDSLCDLLAQIDRADVKDIVDVVLYGVDRGCFLLPLFEQGDTDTRVDFSRLLVSKSSLNIYGRYRRPDGEYRSVSLLHPEDGTAKEFFMAAPTDSVPDGLEGLMVRIEQEPLVLADGEKMWVYRCSSKLWGLRKPFLGQPFCNYLAYNVAYHRAGLHLLNYCLKYAMKKCGVEKQQTSTETAEERPVRGQVSNVIVEHIWDRDSTKDFLSSLQEKPDIPELVKARPHLMPYLEWYLKLSKEGWSFSDTDFQRMSGICYRLQADCVRAMLPYSLELLEQRGILVEYGWLLDPTDIVFKGGGVVGSSRKVRS